MLWWIIIFWLQEVKSQQNVTFLSTFPVLWRGRYQLWKKYFKCWRRRVWGRVAHSVANKGWIKCSMQTVKTSTFFMHWHYPQSILVLCISVSHRPQASLCAALQSQAWPATAAREFTFPKRTKYSCESRGSYRPAGRLWCIPHLPPVWTTSPEWTTSTHQTQATGRCPECALHKCAPVYSSEYLFQVCAHSVHCTTPSKCLYLKTLWWSAMCSRNVDSMDTLHSFRRGQQQFQGHSGHSCGQWTPVRKLTLLRTCKNLLQKSFRKSTFQSIRSQHQLKIANI